MVHNYSIITGMVQNIGNLIIFHTGIGQNYEYAMYNIELNMITTYGNAQCDFGNGVLDTFYVEMQYYSYFITKATDAWYIGQLTYDVNTLNVTGCRQLYNFDAIPINDEYYGGDIHNNASIVVLTSSGVYYLDFTGSESTKVILTSNVNISMLESINFTIPL